MGRGEKKGRKEVVERRDWGGAIFFFFLVGGREEGREILEWNGLSIMVMERRSLKI